jgi:glycosyltransferase involved in cell wall biosynthesis
MHEGSILPALQSSAVSARNSVLEKTGCRTGDVSSGPSDYRHHGKLSPPIPLPKVILLGTDFSEPRGGIGAAMPGYHASLETQGLLECFIPTYKAGSFRGKWWLALKAVAPMIQRIKKLRADGVRAVVYTHAGAWPSLVREALLLAVARAAGAATLLQIHAVSVDRYLSHRTGRFLFGRLANVADVFCALTPWWAARLRAAGIEHRIEVIPNPLSPELEVVAKQALTEKARGRDGTNFETITILTMTRLVRGKGVDIVLEALKYLPARFRCIVAGEGPERARMERWVRAAGLENRVVFKGWVSGADKERVWAEADVFCLPSVHDSFGMGIIEAMARGIPPIALRRGPIAEIVKHGETGILTEGGDPRAVAAAVRALAAAPEIRTRMGEAGRRRVLESFSIEVVGERLKALVDSLDSFKVETDSLI